jgi:hypothetical protein
MTLTNEQLASADITLEFVELHDRFRDGRPALKITASGRSVAFPYSFTGQAPTEVQIFDAILSDVCTYENARSYQEWCSEYDFDPDETESHKRFEAVAEQALWLKDILGDWFDTLVFSE